MSKIKIDNVPFGPFPAALIGAVTDGKINYALAGAVGCVCLDPVLYVSLKNSHYTTAGIKESGYFSINIPSVELLAEADLCGIVSGKDTDKSKLFHNFFADLGKAPMIEECPLNFLCQVFQETAVRGFDVFFGEIVAAYVSQDKMTDNKPDIAKMEPFMMMGASYCNIEKIIGYPFVEGKTLI